MVSILILTRNEELDLPGCLESVRWSDDVHVFDSFSTDRTLEIAGGCGARIQQRVFDNYAAQRNAALAGSPFKYPWVFILDGDERVTPELSRELSAFSPPDEIAAGRVRRRDFFNGRWLKHAQISPYYIRLVRPERVRYEREVNEVLTVQGGVRELGGFLDHHPFSKGVRHWIEKHNTYSSMEASLIHRHADGVPNLWKAVFSRDFNLRRREQKRLFYQLPFRPAIKLFYMLFVRGAVLDGREGCTYAMLQATYEYFIVLKTREFRKQIQSTTEG